MHVTHTTHPKTWKYSCRNSGSNSPNIPVPVFLIIPVIVEGINPLILHPSITSSFTHVGTWNLTGVIQSGMQIRKLHDQKTLP